MNKDKRDLEFLYEIGTLRNVPRGWRQHLATDVASVLEHSFRMVWIAILLARKEGADENKVIKMVLIHDTPEARTSDLSYIQKVYVNEDDDKAAHDQLTGTSLEDYYTDILAEYKQRESIESKIVKDADNLDIELELKELEERGSLIVTKWKDNRKLVRNEKLYTDAAKQMWDDIQDSDVSSWHLKANKWRHHPNAGK